jgi:uridine phosphorylase
VSEPIITPARFLGRDALPSTLRDCTVALAAFCRLRGMKGKLSAQPLSESVFSHLDSSHQFIGQVGESRILAVECLYGGPLSATVIEELAHYGIEHVIAYGYAGSLTADISVGQIVLAESALVSDGASREYLPHADLVYPDDELLRAFREYATTYGVAIRESKVWTTDAIYREYPEKVAGWRQAGAQVVNMDTSHLYSVGSVLGISCLYACVVSDSVAGSVWENGFRRIEKATRDLQDLVLAVLSQIVQVSEDSH